jgi:hypothetical protein
MKVEDKPVPQPAPTQVQSTTNHGLVGINKMCCDFSPKGKEEKKEEARCVAASPKD